MKIRRIKLVWGASKVIRGKWFFGLVGLYDRTEGSREDGLAISLRGLLLWAAALAVAAYVAATAALFSFWQRNPYCLLTYSDAFFYPVRRGEVAAKKGQAFIAEGQELVRIGKWADGARYLRQGLTLYPGDLNARITLARFHQLANQRPMAMNVLTEGLTDEYPGRRYLQVLFDTAEQGEDFGQVAATAARYAPRLEGVATATDRRWLASRQFAALIAAGRAADAQALAETEAPGEMASEHRVLAALEAKRPDVALAFLAAWRQRPGADLGAVRRLEVRTFREAGDRAGLARALAEMREQHPSDPRQAIYAVVQWALAGADDSAREALDDFVFRFGGTAANLQLLAEPLAEIGQRALLERCAAAAVERGYPPGQFRLLLVQTHVKRGEWAEARRGFAQLKGAAAGRVIPAAEQFWFDWMGRVLDAAVTPTEASQLALVEFMRGRPWPLAVFRRTIEALRSAGRTETAREVIGFAAAAFPASPWLQLQKTEVAGALAAKTATAESVGATAATEKPVTGRRDFFLTLEKHLAAREWTAAEQAIRAVRGSQPRPGWVEQVDGDMRFAEVQIFQGKGDLPGLVTAAGLYLNGDSDRAVKIIGLAREFADGGDKRAAVMLVQAILKVTPEHGAAMRMLAELVPRRGK